MRDYETGARRSSKEGKIDYRGFISPVALRMFGAYMAKHQECEDGSLREGDNWKRGMPLADYVDSLTRHVVEFWSAIECGDIPKIEESICGVFFNAQGFMDLWAGGVDQRTMELERMWLGYRLGAEGPSPDAAAQLREFLRRMRPPGEPVPVEAETEVLEVKPERRVPRYENPVAVPKEEDPYEDRFLKTDVVVTPPVEPKREPDGVWQEWVPTPQDDPNVAPASAVDTPTGPEAV